MKRVLCLIDGFNLYHGIDELGENHLKWLDLRSLASSYIDKSKESLIAVYYFSAYATWKPDPYSRHRAYVASLKATAVNVVMGHFKERPRECPSCNYSWLGHEEKETDVHIAVHLVRGACLDEFDKALLITADSDLVPAIETVLRIAPQKEILILSPPCRSSLGLRQLANGYPNASHQKIRRAKIARHLFPQLIHAAGSSIIRPKEYDPP